LIKSESIACQEIITDLIFAFEMLFEKSAEN
jgi:hypothetical protein